MASTSIGVYARLRPVARRTDEGCSVDPGGCSILIRNLEFQLDRIFDEQASQEEVYEVVGRDRVAQVTKGFNVCLVAYGQTGSGKTHTMFGPEEVLANWRGAAADQHGIALRAMSELFEAASDAYTITCSYVEVYNDTCNDLLAPQKKTLPLRESPSGAPYVAGVTEEAVANVDYALSALSRGTARRATAQMSMNARSSRSHAVFSLALRGSGGATDGSMMSGKLVLVDLAGMESSKKSSSVEGASSAGPRREEAKHINTSLYALGTVIERLSAANRAADANSAGGGGGTATSGLSHVPFRNSKLTRLLQECLHGNTAPAFIATLRAEPQNLEECMATLRFAQRAKAVPVVVRANVQAAPPDAEALKRELVAVTRELGEAKVQIERLQREMHAGRRHAAGAADADDARESALLAGRLQLGQLAEQMAALVEQSRETHEPLGAAAAGAAASADGGSGWWPWSAATAGTVEPPQALTRGAAGGGPAGGGPASGGAAQAPPAGSAGSTEQAAQSTSTAQAKAIAAAAQARAAEVMQAQKAVEETKAQAAEALRAERVRAAKVVKAAQAEAAQALEKRAAESREWREKAAAEAEKRNKAASKAASAVARAEEQAAAAERERARADAAEQRAAAEKARADTAEAVAKAAAERVARADAERERSATVAAAEAAAAVKAATAAEAASAAEAAEAAEAVDAFVAAEAARAAVASNDASEASRGRAATSDCAGQPADDTDPFPALVASASAARRIQRSQERATRLPSPTAPLPTVPSPPGHGDGRLMLSRPDLIQRLYSSTPPVPAHATATMTAPDRNGPSAASESFTPRTAAVVEASRKEALLIQQLSFIFPALPEVELRAALERFEWSVDAAACELIDVVGLA